MGPLYSTSLTGSRVASLGSQAFLWVSVLLLNIAAFQAFGRPLVPFSWAAQCSDMHTVAVLLLLGTCRCVSALLRAGAVLYVQTC